LWTYGRAVLSTQYDRRVALRTATPRIDGSIARSFASVMPWYPWWVARYASTAGIAARSLVTLGATSLAALTDAAVRTVVAIAAAARRLICYAAGAAM
jgi:phosphoribosylformylglycinamidine (FGAM) synthase-like enzyme